MEGRTTFDQFFSRLHALLEQLDALHDVPDPWDRALPELRKQIIREASHLQERVAGFTNFLAQQQMLTPERKDDLARLHFSLGYLASTLRLSMARSWGYRIDPSTTPADTVAEWAQHVHTARHVAKKLESVRVMLTESTTVPKAGAEAAALPVVQRASDLDRKTSEADENSPCIWKDIQNRLLGKRERGEPYTSSRMLAKECGCSDSTIRKVIKISNVLQGWKARNEKPKAAPPAQSLNEKALDKLPQTREATPDEYLPDDDVDNLMAKLISEAKPEERAELNAMNTQQRRELVRAYQEQSLDDEPSPLKPDRKHPKLYKRA